MRHERNPFAADGGGYAVCVFGDGALPEILLSCLQFRLAAVLAARGRATTSQLLQLHGHLVLSRCRACCAELSGAPAADRRLPLRTIAPL